jgi:hypothetical protein
MAIDYSPKVCADLENKFNDLELYRPVRTEHYDAGTELTYEMTAVESAEKLAKVALTVEKFVGGGFAGQVYRVQVTSIETDAGQVEEFAGVEKNSFYAMKILIPPSNGSLFFRNLVYRIGFQAAFQLQTNPIAARSGAIWQKFIRRAAKIRFGDEAALNDIHVTFVENKLGSCG